jgi:hypothetical protein
MDPFGGTIFPMLLFPNRDDFFQGVDQPLARLEGVPPMGRADSDRDTGFGKVDTAQAMDDAALDDGPATAGFRFQLFQLSMRQLSVAFVIEP